MSFTQYFNFFQRLFFLLLVLFHYIFANECHSCLQSCETTADGHLTPDTCDCQANTHDKNQTLLSTCFGDRCFVKIEFFPDESIAIIQVYISMFFLEIFSLNKI